MKSANIKPLQPCPFCGASGDTFVSVNKSWESFYVKCFECGARSGLCEDEETAQAAWNRREEND